MQSLSVMILRLFEKFSSVKRKNNKNLCKNIKIEQISSNERWTFGNIKDIFIFVVLTEFKMKYPVITGRKEKSDHHLR